MVNDARAVNIVTTEYLAIAGNVRRDRADLTRCRNVAAFLVSSRRSTLGVPVPQSPADRDSAPAGGYAPPGLGKAWRRVTVKSIRPVPEDGVVTKCSSPGRVRGHFGRR